MSAGQTLDWPNIHSRAEPMKASFNAEKIKKNTTRNSVDNSHTSLKAVVNDIKAIHWPAASAAVATPIWK